MKDKKKISLKDKRRIGRIKDSVFRPRKNNFLGLLEIFRLGK